MKNDKVAEKFQKAVDEFCGKLKEDKNVLAVIVLGSLSYDKVWEKSDVDIAVVVNDNTAALGEFVLIENDVYFNGATTERTEFVKFIANSAGGSFGHSMFAHGTIVFSRDEKINEILAGIRKNLKIGIKDMYDSMLVKFAEVLKKLYEIERWLELKDNPKYSYYLLMEMLKDLAGIEVLRNRGVPNREVILQAVEYGNDTFEKLYIELLEREKTVQSISEALDLIYEYINNNRDEIFRVMIEYFNKKGSIKSVSTIRREINNRYLDDKKITKICEWMRAEGIINRDMEEVFIIKRGKVGYNEPAFI